MTPQQSSGCAAAEGLAEECVYSIAEDDALLT
jgi:hypothetical protein